ncbi:MAG: hypothetical protein Q9M24_07450 [Mariprofundaceae bacterium]|nr:hypothetical protein [Mariprofundaceae bacterium]
MAFILLAPSLTRAEVSIMKAAPARGLIGSDGSRPVSLSTTQWLKALGSIRYTNETFLASSGPKPVFSDQQIHMLAPQIRQALANIRPGQAVAFHQGKIRGDIFFSGGRLYWYFSDIENDAAFKLTELAEEDARMSYAVEAIPDEDIDVSHWELIPQQGQSLYRGRPDLLAMPVSTLTPDTMNTALLPATKQSQPPARIQNRPVAMVADADAVSRISTLHRLLGKGLISKDEYRGKLEIIIPKYMTQHPSPEAGLEFLRVLDKKGLIAPDMLQKQRKQLLDRL